MADRSFYQTTAICHALVFIDFFHRFISVAYPFNKERRVFLTADDRQSSRSNQAGKILHIEIMESARNIVARTMIEFKNGFRIRAECAAMNANLDTFVIASSVKDAVPPPNFP